jgi:hypothetical protein
VCADIEDFRQMSDGEGMAIEFYKPGDARDLAQCLIRFLSDPAKQKAMAEQNFSAALRMTMPNIVLKYLRHFELEKRSSALRQVLRLRKLPSWVPSRPLLLRLMTHNSLGWVPRSALQRPSPRPPASGLQENSSAPQAILHRAVDPDLDRKLGPHGHDGVHPTNSSGEGVA